MSYYDLYYDWFPLSIPDEPINFDLVYSIRNFVAKAKGQANVVQGDSLILMDDSDNYWLVKVLETHEVGYVPAEHIETPFERLARLNKHRNVDLVLPTEQEEEEEEEKINLTPSSTSPDPSHPLRLHSRLTRPKSVRFNASFPVHRYLPAVWKGDEEDENTYFKWDDVSYIGEDPGLAEEEREAFGSVPRNPDTSIKDTQQWNTEMTIDDEMQAQVRARQLLEADVTGAHKVSATAEADGGARGFGSDNPFVSSTGVDVDDRPLQPVRQPQLQQLQAQNWQQQEENGAAAVATTALHPKRCAEETEDETACAAGTEESSRKRAKWSMSSHSSSGDRQRDNDNADDEERGEGQKREAWGPLRGLMGFAVDQTFFRFRTPPIPFFIRTADS
ncbi:hypothetical protein APHAL10511_003245 [Amanita phalloides]|nr:hypothetical protein APHAL10511_003245 [Amanita phalloides]